MGHKSFIQVLWFQHAAVARFTASLRAATNTENGCAIGRYLRQIAPRGRVGVHLPVHGGGNQQGCAGRPRQAGQANQFGGLAMR